MRVSGPISETASNITRVFNLHEPLMGTIGQSAKPSAFLALLQVIPDQMPTVTCQRLVNLADFEK
jgi:hypothetical protein